MKYTGQLKSWRIHGEERQKTKQDHFFISSGKSLMVRFAVAETMVHVLAVRS